MDHTTFRRIRTESLGWSQEKLAYHLGIDDTTVRRYEARPEIKSHRPIPVRVAVVMRLIDNGHVTGPALSAAYDLAA